MALFLRAPGHYLHSIRYAAREPKDKRILSYLSRERKIVIKVITPDRHLDSSGLQQDIKAHQTSPGEAHFEPKFLG